MLLLLCAHFSVLAREDGKYICNRGKFAPVSMKMADNDIGRRAAELVILITF